MIHITIKYDEWFDIQIEDHAGYATKGSNIVCAAISTLYQTMVQTIQTRSYGEMKHIRSNDGFEHIKRLKPKETEKFIHNSFSDGMIKETGTGIDSLMPPMSRFGGGGNRAKKKHVVIDKLKGFFNKYQGIAPTI